VADSVRGGARACGTLKVTSFRINKEGSRTVSTRGSVSLGLKRRLHSFEKKNEEGA
jgi:hypothetical protein